MRKYGKYEKRPEVVPAKQPKATSMLLQTYFMSLLCMVLCVTMFFGTSYAWFTSEASYGANEIYVGTLNVGLYKDDAKLNSDSTLFDSSFRWKPNDTQYVTITVKNEGTMDFKYELSFVPSAAPEGTTTPAAEETVTTDAVAGCFEVKVFDHSKGTYTEPADYADTEAENSGWTKVGTLAELFGSKTVLSDELPADDVTKAHTYTIALHMNETAEPSVMGQKITFNVKLVAYQLGMPTADGAAGQEDANA